MKLTATPEYLALDVRQTTRSFSVRSAPGARLDRGVVQTRAHDRVAALCSVRRQAGFVSRNVKQEQQREGRSPLHRNLFYAVARPW